MQADIYGLENILKYIEATRLTKFTIQKAGANGSYIPVFEVTDSESNGQALNEFKKWAEVVNQNQPYKITLFNTVTVEADENTGEPKAKKAKGKANKMEATFFINSALSTGTSQQPNINNTGAFDIGSLKADIIKQLAKEQSENEILNEIKSLRAKITELEDEEEEEEEEETGSIAGISPEKITQLMGLVNLFKGGEKPPVINGADEHNEMPSDKITTLNKAIKTLYKHNSNLHNDLLKLSEIAEQKPDTFKMFVDMLRKF